MRFVEWGSGKSCTKRGGVLTPHLGATSADQCTVRALLPSLSFNFRAIERKKHFSAQFFLSDLRRNMKRFRGGLVFEAHRLVYHLFLGLRVI